MVYPPYEQRPPKDLMSLVEQAPAGERKRVWVEGQNLDGQQVRKGVLLPLGDTGPARERLRRLGLTVMTLGDEVQVGSVAFGSQAEKLGLEQGFRIVAIEMPADRPAKEWMYLPALLLLAIVFASQRARRRNEPASGAALARP
jgi:hypothetical protein